MAESERASLVKNKFANEIARVIDPNYHFNLKKKIATESSDELLEPPEPDVSAIQMVNDIVDADATLQEKIATLEEFCDIIETQVDVPFQHICREAAAALEDFEPGIFGKKYPVKSFTIKPSKTNYQPAMEAIDSKIIAIVGAIVAALLALIAKLFGSNKNAVETIQERIEKVDDVVDEKHLDKIEKMPEVLDEKKDEAKEAGVLSTVTKNDIADILFKFVFRDEPNSQDYPRKVMSIVALFDFIHEGDQSPTAQFLRVIHVYTERYGAMALNIIPLDSDIHKGLFGELLKDLKALEPINSLNQDKLFDVLVVFEQTLVEQSQRLCSDFYKDLSKTPLIFDEKDIAEKLKLVETAARTHAPSGRDMNFTARLRMIHDTMAANLTALSLTRGTNIKSKYNPPKASLVPKDIFENVNKYTQRLRDTLAGPLFKWTMEIPYPEDTNKLDQYGKIMEKEIIDVLDGIEINDQTRNLKNIVLDTVRLGMQVYRDFLLMIHLLYKITENYSTVVQMWNVVFVRRMYDLVNKLDSMKDMENFPKNHAELEKWFKSLNFR